jgi:hypothetical protein
MEAPVEIKRTSNRTWEVSTPVATETVCLGADGKLGCTCFAFNRFKEKGYVCSHIKAVITEMEREYQDKIAQDTLVLQAQAEAEATERAKFEAEQEAEREEAYKSGYRKGAL